MFRFYYFRFPSPLFVIGLNISRHILSQSEVEAKARHFPALSAGCLYFLCVLIGSYDCQRLFVIGKII